MAEARPNTTGTARGKEPTRTTDDFTWACAAARAAAAKTEEETVVLDVGSVLSITGAFVITAGRNPRQVKALAEEIEEKVALAGGPKPKRREGLDALEWVLLDYGDFVVHVFHYETRKYYELERLWSDVPRIEWRDGSEVAATATEDSVADELG